ncbi:MAG TPA: hypothetical protein VLH79_03850 [Chthonomonadales bacterium]|nr:hypothetical protein [Chthonomonadales bacterium]
MRRSMPGALALATVLLLWGPGRASAQTLDVSGLLTGSLASYSFTADQGGPWTAAPAEGDGADEQNEWMLWLLLGGAVVGLSGGGGCPSAPLLDTSRDGQTGGGPGGGGGVVVSESAHVASAAGLAVAGLLLGWRRKRS